MKESIKKHGKKAKGRKEILKYFNGKRITRDEAIKAKCYECMGYYADGVQDCGISECPLYLYHSYRSQGLYKPYQKLKGNKTMLVSS